MFLETIKRVMPAGVFIKLHSIPFYFWETISHPNKGEIIPPLHLQTDGPRGYDTFRQCGRNALGFYKEVLSLKPDAKILDIGCGVGRKTIPLMDYLDDNGLYVGLDVDQHSIDWCTRNITSKRPNFLFFRIDIYNNRYNRKGSVLPANLRLPFSDGMFDMVSMWSVFTHMFPADAEQYLRESRRVLAPNGKLVISYYIVNEETKRTVAAGLARWQPVHYLREHGCWTINPNIPEDLLGWPEEKLRLMYQTAGLKIEEPIMFGAWGNRPIPEKLQHLNSQDIVIASRAP
jgi:SAM-dependent methyltransferase